MNRSAHRGTTGVVILVVLVSTFSLEGCTLLGIGIGAAVDHGKHDVEVAGWQFEEVKPGTQLELILKSGETIKGEYLDRGATGAAGASSAAAPVVPSIRLLVEEKKLSYAVDDVGMVRIRPGRSGKRVGAILGLGVDLALVYAASRPIPCDPEPNLLFGCNSTGSCPFAYSYDGQSYILEGEMFGGAIFKASQRADRVRFERLVAHEGEYRVRLANLNQEIQYVDQVRLLVVDHPEGAEVLPTLGGELVSFAHRLPPDRAVDLRGANVLSLVRDDDGDPWTSVPFGRDPTDPAQLRDGLVLEFPRPPDAQTVKLAFTLKSTTWAAGLLNRLVGLQGRDVDAWRDRMNAQPAERVAFHNALRREGVLRLSVWDGQDWRDTTVLANVGPGAARRQAVRLDLREVPGRTLRIRLDSTPGMWMVDAAAADYSGDLPSSVLELEPSRATGHDGRDLRGALSAADGRYYTMPTTSDSAEVAFTEPPPPSPGHHRTFIFEASGYYSILVPPTEPRLALFDELVGTPGAFARYSLGLAAEEVARAQAGLTAARDRGAGDPRARKP